MGLAAATITVKLQDSDGQDTTRSYEARLPAVTDGQAAALADALQAITQLEVIDVTISRRVTSFTPTAAEINSSVAETASLSVPIAGGGKHTFNLPALKSAVKSGKNVNTLNTALLTFLDNFDDGSGTAATTGNFFVSDGEALDEAAIEDDKFSGKVNR